MDNRYGCGQSFLLGLGFVLASVRGDHAFLGLVIAVVALVAQCDQPGFVERVKICQIRAAAGYK